MRIFPKHFPSYLVILVCVVNCACSGGGTDPVPPSYQVTLQFNYEKPDGPGSLRMDIREAGAAANAAPVAQIEHADIGAAGMTFEDLEEGTFLVAAQTHLQTGTYEVEVYWESDVAGVADELVGVERS